MKFRIKLFLSMLFVIISIELSIYALIYNYTFSSMRNEADKLSISFVNLTSQYIVNDVLVRDVVKVGKLLNKIKRTNKDIVFIYIIDDENNLFTSTFNNGIPAGILDWNRGFKTVNVNTLINADKVIIHDVGVKMVEGLEYEMHIGFAETSIENVFHFVTKRFVIIFAFTTLFLLIISYHLSGFLTKPLEELYRFAERLKDRKFGTLIRPKGSIEVKQITESLNQLSTEMFRYEENLKKSINKLILTEKMDTLHTVKVGILHEIKSSITSIKLLVSALDKTTIQNDDIGIIRTEIDNIEVLLRNFVGDINEKELSPGYVNLHDIIDSSIAEYKNTNKNKHITISVLYPEEIKFIKGYYILLKHLFFNLLRNSYDAILDNGTIRISVSYRDDSTIEILFSDNGQGIDNIHTHKIFDPFYTTKRDGTGMGLYIAYNIVMIHHGKIDVQSSEKGTTFSILLRSIK